MCEEVNKRGLGKRSEGFSLASSPLLLVGIAIIRRVTARNLGSDLEEDLAEVVAVLVGKGGTHHRMMDETRVVHAHQLGIVDQIHNKRARPVRAGMLGQVVGARELLAALGALERLVLGVERPVVTLKVLLAAEATVANVALEGLGRVFGQGLLAAAAVGRHGERRRSLLTGLNRGLGSGIGLGVVALGLGAGGLLGVLGSRGLLLGAGGLVIGSNVHGGLACVSCPLAGAGLVIRAAVVLNRLSVVHVLELVAEKAGLVDRAGSAGAGARAAGDAGGALNQGAGAAGEGRLVLRVNVGQDGEDVEDREAGSKLGVEGVVEGGGQSLRGNALGEVVAVLLVGRVDGGEVLGSKGGIDSAHGKLARIADAVDGNREDRGRLHKRRRGRRDQGGVGGSRSKEAAGGSAGVWCVEVQVTGGEHGHLDAGLVGKVH